MPAFCAPTSIALGKVRLLNSMCQGAYPDRQDGQRPVKSASDRGHKLDPGSVLDLVIISQIELQGRSYPHLPAKKKDGDSLIWLLSERTSDADHVQLLSYTSQRRKISRLRHPVKNVVILGTGRGIEQGFVFMVFLLVARLAGATALGQLSFVFALTGFSLVLSGLGLNLLITRDVARSPGLTSRYVNRTLLLPMGGCFCVGMFLVIGLTAAGYPRSVCMAAVFLSIDRTLDAGTGVLLATFRARGKFVCLSVAVVAGRSLTLALTLLSLLQGGSIVVVSAAFPIGSMISLILAIGFYRNQFGLTIQPEFNPSEYRKLIRAAYPFWLVSLLAVVQSRSGLILLNLFHGDRAVGIFTAAHSLVAGATILSGAVVNSMIPSLSRIYLRSIPRLQAIYRRSLLLLFALGVPGAFIISMVARPLILWVFGPDFDEAAGVLQILSWAMLLAFLSSLSSGFLAGSNLQHQWLKIAVVATIVNLGSGLVFVPPLQSIGAGIVAVLTYLLLFLLSWWRLTVFFRDSRIRADEE